MERGTAGRPTCRTWLGRTVYGGGIFPDVVLDEPARPAAWLARLVEDDLLVRWAGAYIDDYGGTIGELEDFVRQPPSGEALAADFDEFVARLGPSALRAADVRARLGPLLLREIAVTRWGAAGYFRLVAASDPQVEQARAEFAAAAGLLTVLEPGAEPGRALARITFPAAAADVR